MFFSRSPMLSTPYSCSPSDDRYTNLPTNTHRNILSHRQPYNRARQSCAQALRSCSVSTRATSPSSGLEESFSKRHSLPSTLQSQPKSNRSVSLSIPISPDVQKDIERDEFPSSRERMGGSRTTSSPIKPDIHPSRSPERGRPERHNHLPAMPSSSEPQFSRQPLSSARTPDPRHLLRRLKVLLCQEEHQIHDQLDVDDILALHERDSIEHGQRQNIRDAAKNLSRNQGGVRCNGGRSELFSYFV